MSRTYHQEVRKYYRKEHKEERRRILREEKRRIKAQTDDLGRLPELWADCAPEEHKHTEGRETW